MFEKYFKSKETVEYITLEEMRKESKSGIIVLESEYFKIVKIVLGRDLEEKERELEIEENLEEKIGDYTPIEYIEKEISLEIKEDKEEIVVILLNRSIVEGIIEEGKEKKIKILGIIPAFFLRNLEIENNINEIFIDIDENSGVVTKFKNGKIKDIFIIDAGKEKILESELEDILQYIFVLDSTKLNKLSFYEKDREIWEIFENVNNIDAEISDWKEKNIVYKYEYDFLPLEYLDSLKKNSFIKKAIIIFFGIFILQMSVGGLFQYFYNLTWDKLEGIEKNIVEYQEEIEDIREKIVEIEEKEKIMRAELEKIQFKKLKLSEILEKIDKVKPKEVNIFNIELDEKNRLKIIGNSLNENKILKLQEEISKESNFRNINHDYIKREEEIYNFQLEVEVIL